MSKKRHLAYPGIKELSKQFEKPRAGRMVSMVPKNLPAVDLHDVIRKLGRQLFTRKKVKTMNQLAREIHRNAKEKGFWPRGRSDAECIALIHSEVSEALEALRAPILPKDPYAFVIKHEPGKPPKPYGLHEELADIIIRVLDFSAARKIDIDRAVRMKIAYNKTRKHKHGKKF